MQTHTPAARAWGTASRSHLSTQRKALLHQSLQSSLDLLAHHHLRGKWGAGRWDQWDSAALFTPES